jgi:hypothetical protein
MSAFEVTVTPASDGFPLPQGPDDPLPAGPRHPLDSQDNKNLLARLEDWWQEARDQHAQNRMEQMLDADYYDTVQWTAADASVLAERGQAPLSFPLIKQVCDWIIGTERRTRIDWDVLPRKDEDVYMATVKKEVLKWVSDINGAGWERSRQFADVVRVGIGWTEECYNNDRREEPITIRYQDWKGVWWDPYSRDNLLRDCRYVVRAKWLDLDYAVSMFPDRADELRGRAVTMFDAAQELMELEQSLPMMFFGSANPMTQKSAAYGFMGYGSPAKIGRSRSRVLALETWFKVAENVPLMMGDSEDELNGQRFDMQDPAHVAAISGGTLSLVDSVTETMRYALWTPGCLLRVNDSPYKHKKFTFTPAWGYRRHRDGMPYGAVRPSRDAQDEYNKRRSKILFQLSTNQVWFETDAMDEADERRNLEEAKRPDGEVRLAPGGLEKVKVEKGLDALTGQVKMLDEARQNIYEASGVTRENTGTSGGSDQSGRAILAKQQQGAVTTAELFDNYRQAIQESGQKVLSLCEQFLSLPKVVRIVGADGGFEWLQINQPVLDAQGNVLWHNDITASEADFIVDQSDYRETVRMAMSEMLFELIGRMPPEAGLQLLDIAIDMTDLPNKQALAARLRKLNGQPAPGQENSPEADAAAQAAAAQQQRSQQLDDAERMSKVRLNNAQADRATAEARKTAVVGKKEALDTAGMVASVLPLAPAADRLYSAPMPSEQTQPTQ